MSLVSINLKPWPHRASASASALTLGQCFRLGMTLMLVVGCTDVNQCGPLQAATLTVGVVRPLPESASATVTVRALVMIRLMITWKMQCGMITMQNCNVF